MFLLHPLWLAAMFPWTALVAYLIRRGVPTSVAVPFLQLWPGEVQSAATRAHRLAPLPLPVILILIALLLAIVAAAGPARRGAGTDVTVIVDRGITLSVRGDLARLIDSVDRQLHAEQVHLSILPGSSIDTDGSSWAALARRAGPTAIDTESMVRQAIIESLAHDNYPVIAITDAAIPADPRVSVVTPGSPLVNVGIAAFAVTDGRHPQAMVRVRNRSNAQSAVITITGGASPVTRPVALAAAGADADVFVDLPQPLSEIITATLSSDHTSPVNDHASVVRTSGGPLHWSAVGAVPDSIKRMIDVYSRLRPARADADSATVRFDSEDRDGTGVWLVPSRSDDIEHAAPLVTPDRLTTDVRVWPPSADPAAVAPAGWHVLVRSGSASLLAAAPGGRGVWFNGRLDKWSTTPNFVVFFANVFDAVATGQGDWAAYTTHSLPPPWHGSLSAQVGTPVGDTPGIYRNASNQLALNAPPLPSRSDQASSSLASLPAVVGSPISLTSWLALTASILAGWATLQIRRNQQGLRN